MSAPGWWRVDIDGHVHYKRAMTKSHAVFAAMRKASLSVPQAWVGDKTPSLIGVERCMPPEGTLIPNPGRWLSG